jgi:predicted O-linked N-acetylglucosamine transferase (SPINDLY family)
MTKKNILTHSKKRKALELVQGSYFAEARTLCVEICRLDTRDAEAWFMLGTINGKLNNAEEAVECFRRTTVLSPGNALAYFNMGLVLSNLGKLDEAVEAFAEAARLAPQRAEILSNLGRICISLGRMEEAASWLRKLLGINHRDATAYASLGSVLHVSGKLEEAIDCYRQSLRLKPDNASIHDNLGSALCEQGRQDEAIASHREALRLNPNDAKARSNFLLTLNYLPVQNASEVLDEHRQWAAMHERVKSVACSFANVRDSGRRLRVGYVSPDFRAHSIAYFFEPLLASHDTMVVESYCYSAVGRPDDTTMRLKGLAHKWTDISGMTDEQAAVAIRADGVDILVDLAGHTAGNRLGIFVRRPAPVQVTYLGYPNTTGLHAIDYRLTDVWSDPEGVDSLYTEKLLRLPGGFLCFHPLVECPVVSASPAVACGHVTFGSFNNLAKISPGVVSLWAKLLEAVPDAHLFIKNHSLTDPATCERYYGLFKARGVLPTRVALMGSTPSQQEHLALYSRVDIALDTFPYNGTTTTCEALWMGVPVVTLAGERHSGRVGVSLLNAVGHPEWIAESPEHYIALAAKLATDLPKLAALRAGLRAYMAASPLCNRKAFAAKVEAAYREMWHRHCAS